MLKNIIALKTWTRKLGCAFAFFGLSLPLVNSAFAISAGCTAWNVTNPNNDGLLATNVAFSAWEVAKITFTHNSGASPNNYTYTYTDNNNAANSRSATAGSTTTGETVTLTIQIPADTTDGRLFWNASGTTALYSFTGNCVAGTEPVIKASTSSASTTAAVISAVSRSQTTVIQRNIASRVSSAISTDNNSSTDNVQRPPPSMRETGTHRTGLTGATASDDPDSITDRNEALRLMAMMGSFDSSTGHGMNMLGLGPADPGNNGDIGGVSDIDGRSALQSESPFTVWGHGSFTSVESNYVNGATNNSYDGDVWGYSVGLDYKFADALIAGLSLGYTDTDLSTAFNNGSYKETGWTASPYVIYRPMPNLNIVAEAGYGIGDIGVTRGNSTTFGTTESDMWYAALSTSYRIQAHDTLPVSLTPSMAFIAARKTVDGYRESDGTAVGGTTSNTRQIKPAIEAAYRFTPTQSLTITPFLETGLIYDFTDETNNDKNAFNIGGGVRLFESAIGLNAALEGSYLAGRSDYTQYTIGGTITYGFALTNQDGQQVGILTPSFSSDLNEYGNQRLQAGVGFDRGRFSSQVAVEHMMSGISDADNAAPIAGDSRVSVRMSMPF